LEKKGEIWAKIFCILKNMHSRTPMYERPWYQKNNLK